MIPAVLLASNRKPQQLGMAEPCGPFRCQTLSRRPFPPRWDSMAASGPLPFRSDRPLSRVAEMSHLRCASGYVRPDMQQTPRRHRFTVSHHVGPR